MTFLNGLAFAAVAFARPDMLVTTEWLAAHLSDENVRIVEFRRGEEDYAKGHIPNAVFLSNDALRDPKNPPTFLPSKAAFEKAMGALGVTNRTRVIAYDDRGGLYAARLWFVSKIYGFDNVALLDGHMTKWMKENRSLSTEPARVRPATFTARPDLRWVATANDVVAAIDRKGTRIVDARTQAEIDGKDLRGIKRGGNVPSSVPVYWEDLMDAETKALKPAEDLRALLRSRDVKPEDEVIVYCQVGMRASFDVFVMHLLGYDKVRNYYGAWEEWGNRDDLPLRTMK